MRKAGSKKTLLKLQKFQTKNRKISGTEGKEADGGEGGGGSVNSMSRGYAKERGTQRGVKDRSKKRTTI
jgi:hypothetical protein